MLKLWQLRAWMLCFGFTLGYGSMFSKIWTLYRLKTGSRKSPQVAVSLDFSPLMGN